MTKPINSVEFNLSEEDLSIIGAGLQMLELNLEQMQLYFPNPVQTGEFMERLADLQDRWDGYRDALDQSKPLYN